MFTEETKTSFVSVFFSLFLFFFLSLFLSQYRLQYIDIYIYISNLSICDEEQDLLPTLEKTCNVDKSTCTIGRSKYSQCKLVFIFVVMHTHRGMQLFFVFVFCHRFQPPLSCFFFNSFSSMDQPSSFLNNTSIKAATDNPL